MRIRTFISQRALHAPPKAICQQQDIGAETRDVSRARDARLIDHVLSRRVRIKASKSTARPLYAPRVGRRDYTKSLFPAT